MPGCEGCDFEHAPEACHCRATGWKRGCELAKVRGDYRELIRRMTLGIGPEPVKVEATEAEIIAARRASKPRVALGVDQKAMAKG